MGLGFEAELLGRINGLDWADPGRDQFIEMLVDMEPDRLCRLGTGIAAEKFVDEFPNVKRPPLGTTGDRGGKVKLLFPPRPLKFVLYEEPG